jgi:hypothetical protein
MTPNYNNMPSKRLQGPNCVLYFQRSHHSTSPGVGYAASVRRDGQKITLTNHQQYQNGNNGV